MSSNPTIFSEVIDWFLGRAGDRRQYRRRSDTFHLWWQPETTGADAARLGIGLEISPSGLMFIIPDRIGSEEYNLVLHVQDAKIRARVKNVRSDQVTHKGKPWNRHMGEFTGISADDWDRIVRYVNHEPEPQDRRKMQNQEMAAQADDAYRLLPMAIQQKIVTMLVERRRLSLPPPGQAPLLKLFYGGLVNRPGKKAAHRFNVHSRIKVNDELVAYDTRFIVSDDGEVTNV